jgi:hypothetical protein
MLPEHLEPDVRNSGSERAKGLNADRVKACSRLPIRGCDIETFMESAKETDTNDEPPEVAEYNA